MRVIGINPDAFAHRDGEEYLSATWADFLQTISSDAVTASVEMFRRCITVKKGDGYAVGIVKAYSVDSGDGHSRRGGPISLR